MSICVVFGGAGFIGSHFVNHIIDNNFFARVIVADLAQPRFGLLSPLAAKCIEYVDCDVRNLSGFELDLKDVSLIANFAAIHREPGHELAEYYETNLPGADNVCSWAERVGCNNIIFTSSIAPYGPTEQPKTEDSIPTPNSAYGGSKLAAEKIHQGWQRAGAGRKLVIVRPGVVFGPGEGGNVTRLVQATLRRYFLYMGNRQTRKAGGYVKELVNTMFWALDKIPAQGGKFLYNFTMSKAPTVEEYVDTTCRVAGVKRFVPSVPHGLLLAVSYVIDAIARPLGIKQPISPVRIRKLVRSTNIEPGVLRKEGYQYKYTLETAMQDWRRDRPDEWR